MRLQYGVFNTPYATGQRLRKVSQAAGGSAGAFPGKAELEAELTRAGIVEIQGSAVHGCVDELHGEIPGGVFIRGIHFDLGIPQGYGLKQQ